MKLSIKNLRRYIVEHPLNHATTDTDLLLDDLYWYYAENNPLINERIRSLSNSADCYLTQLTMKDCDALFRIFSDLCTEQERLAFRGGVRIGMQLLLELLEQKPDLTVL